MKLNLCTISLIGFISITTIGFAQPAGRGPVRLNLRSNIFTVASNEAVQKDLGLSADEAAKVKEVANEYRDANLDAMEASGIHFGPNMSQADREKFSSIPRELTEKFSPKLKALLTADQFTRVQQINYQNLRIWALLEPEIIKALSETTEQQERIKAVFDEYQPKVAALIRSRGGADALKDRPNKIEEINQERDAKAIEQLTKEQKEKFAALKGKSFDITQLSTAVPLLNRGAK